jgi:peptidyl-prolyl cis-trans isomerase SurA
MNLEKNIRYKLIYLLILLIIFSFSVKANEVKIVSKIGNEIITNIDVENEYNYLITLNTSLKDIDKNQVILFAKNSLIKEKIKKNELSKFYELNNKNETVDSMIKNIYKSLGLNDKNQFQNYLNNNNLKFEEVYKKLEIESVWNQMIYQRFKKKIFIDEDELKKKISNNQKEIETFLLSEIVVSIENKNEINKKYNELIENINTFGFKESVLKFSVSNSKNNSGSLGWINKNNLSKIIQNELDKIKIGEITKPVLISSGILILKLENKKFIESEQDLDLELQKLIDYEMNNQLNNFSTIYYNKIKKNFL